MNISEMIIEKKNQFIMKHGENPRYVIMDVTTCFKLANQFHGKPILTLKELMTSRFENMIIALIETDRQFIDVA